MFKDSELGFKQNTVIAMADSPTATQAPVPAPDAPAAPTNGMAINRGPGRAERRAAAMARLQSGIAAETAAPADAAKPTTEAPKAPESPKPPEPEKPDPTTERGLRAVEQARKKFLDEQNAAKAELEVQRAEIARLRKEAEGRVTSRDELKKLKPTELLDALEHFTEDDHDLLSRAAYARTKAGKVDPRAQAAAQEAARAQNARGAVAEVEQLKATIEELRSELKGEFTKRDQASFAERWVGEAVKAIPTDKPTFIAKLHANEPAKAQRELILLGAELEKENGGEAPTQAEVIAEFEKRKRAELKALGLDADALLSPPKPAPAPAAKSGARTLDVTAATMTRAENAPKTRAELRERAIANLRARQRATADQT